MAKEYQNFISGEWCDSSSGERFENRNPARWSEVIGTFPRSTPEDVDRAVLAARKAFDSWRKTPAPVRGEIMKKAGDIMVERKEEIAQLMTREMGKVIDETRGDTQEGIDTAFYAFGEGRRLFGRSVPSELPNKTQWTRRRAIGVAGLITPWNFPMAIPTWKTFPALLSGNTVVFKPASDTPATATLFVEILLDAGVPPEAINLVHGGGSTVGNAIVEHDDVDLISFTGSSEVGSIINSKAGGGLKRVSLEMGGKNAQIVMNDANLDLALDGVLWGAFGTTGQRCTATSRLIVQDGVHDEFVEMVIEKAKNLKLGDGLDESVDVGPVINEGAREKIHNYVQIGQDEGAALRLGGDIADKGSLSEGWFYQPTVFTDVTPGMRIEQEEIFGPVLSIIKVKSLDEAIDVLNGVEYGLSSSIYTQDVNRAFTAFDDIHCGITYVNGPTIGAECHMSFGGTKSTGNGHREGGWEVYEFYTEAQTCYVDHSGTLQRAQIDNR
ncbi:MAG: aldehyde dehydrogenase family protein [Candidatus Marinimicrobia bacterium]|nr:aldehyde dehydrogenase family protein [Candidatus Neomarinimicrobiota bacterium]MCF7828263.1 aldehyde dehydrogenase family protein [Candidatus Neomarinimicrobiota bacterium]MCF7879562.1 aldehyde dehydrogenase family protein [Candidatus Neomarinimicrobiota bacterium]